MPPKGKLTNTDQALVRRRFLSLKSELGSETSFIWENRTDPASLELRLNEVFDAMFAEIRSNNTWTLTSPSKKILKTSIVRYCAPNDRNWAGPIRSRDQREIDLWVMTNEQGKKEKEELARWLKSDVRSLESVGMRDRLRDEYWKMEEYSSWLMAQDKDVWVQGKLDYFERVVEPTEGPPQPIEGGKRKRSLESEEGNGEGDDVVSILTVTQPRPPKRVRQSDETDDTNVPGDDEHLRTPARRSTTTGLKRTDSTPITHLFVGHRPVQKGSLMANGNGADAKVVTSSRLSEGSIASASSSNPKSEIPEHPSDQKRETTTDSTSLSSLHLILTHPSHFALPLTHLAPVLHHRLGIRSEETIMAILDLDPDIQDRVVKGPLVRDGGMTEIEWGCLLMGVRRLREREGGGGIGVGGSDGGGSVVKVEEGVDSED